MWHEFSSTAHQIGGVTALAVVCLLQYGWYLWSRRRLLAEQAVLRDELNQVRRELHSAQSTSHGVLIENVVLFDLLAESDSDVALRRLLQAFVPVSSTGVAAYFRRDEHWLLHDAIGLDQQSERKIHPDARLLASLGQQVSVVLEAAQVERTELGRALARSVGGTIGPLYLFRTTPVGESLDGVIVTSSLPETGGSIGERVRLVERLVAAAGRYFHRSAVAAAQEQELRITREILELRSVVDLEFSSPKQMVEQFLNRLMSVCDFEQAGLYLMRRKDGMLALLARSTQQPGAPDNDVWASAERLLAERSVRDLHLAYHADSSLRSGGAEVPFRAAVTVPMHVAAASAGVLVLTGGRSTLLTEADRELLHWSAEYLLETIVKTVDRASIEARASRDGLTGLANRHTFDSAVEGYVERAVHTGRDCTLMMLDLDHFKQINDRYGHPAGDAALRTVASIVQEELRLHVRGTDHPIAARFGGEELAVLLPHVGLAGGLRVAERIRSRIEQTAIQTREGIIRVTLSAGVSAAPSQAETSEELIKAADVALYQAKRAGRNRVVAAGQRATPMETVGSASAS
ncbi:MAG: diguanylate cyclase [Planctomycetaceae bacterium]